MYDGSQIQNNLRKDASDARDNQEKARYSCSACRASYKRLSAFNKHRCKYDGKLEGVDYVICKLCGFKGKSLGKHITNIHSNEMTTAAYKEKFGNIKCESTYLAYSKQNKKNGDWISRANQNGKDLSEYRTKMRKAVSDSIMSNPEERQRRANLLGSLNKRADFRRKSSETAKITSSRADIQANRTRNLKKWREEDWLRFQETCTDKMLAVRISKPEKNLYELVKDYEGYEFKLSQTVKSEAFPTKSKRRKVDMGDKKLRVYIEFDGPLHFEKKFEEQDLENIQLKDRLLDEHMERHGWTLIRISQDQWDGKRFKGECLNELFKCLDNPSPGVTKIGKSYNISSIQ